MWTNLIGDILVTISLARKGVPILNLFVVVEQGIAIKSGKDWSGRMVNISTTNVLAEQNVFLKGHGVSIGKLNIDRD